MTAALHANASLAVRQICSSPEEALKRSGLKNGDSVYELDQFLSASIVARSLVGGFGLCGIPMACIQAVQKMGTKGETCRACG